MLEIRDLSVRTGYRRLLHRLHLQIPMQGVTALLGPSGCGKTTVLKWLAGVPMPELQASGQLLIDGQMLDRPTRAITYQPQGDALFPWLSVAENAGLGLQVAGLDRRTIRNRVLPLLDTFGLDGTADLFPHQLSGGMRQRVAFLRTVLQDGRVLLLDEPFSALDAVTRMKMQDWLAQRLDADARAVLLVTHDLHEATRLADRVIVMGTDPDQAILACLTIDMPRDGRGETALAPLREQLATLLLR